ncbi:hypothetical protein ABVT39_008487 [Epinephelus coioides]
MDKATKQASTRDHDYSLAVVKEACDDEDIQELEDMEESTVTLLNEHTPLPSPDPKRLKKRDMKMRDREANDSIYEAIQTVLQRFGGNWKNAKTNSLSEERKQHFDRNMQRQCQIQEEMGSAATGLAGERQRGCKRGCNWDPDQGDSSGSGQNPGVGRHGSSSGQEK